MNGAMKPDSPSIGPRSLDDMPCSSDADQLEFDSQSSLNACDRQRDCWNQGLRLPVEHFLLENPQLIDQSDQLLDLIYSEVLLREEQGESPTIAEYRLRFPQQADALNEMFEVHEAIETGAVAVSDRSQPRAQQRSDTEPSRRATTQQLDSAELPGYEIMELVGRGGMGVVYRARQVGTNRNVAVKVFFGGDKATPEEIARFSMEAEALALLNHPSIAAVHEAGYRSGIHFLAMEWIDGQTLADKIVASEYSPRESAELIKRIARAIHYAHTRGVVHRDLKPQNILLDQGGEPHIVDFGLAQFRDRDHTWTTGGQILGTLPYMSPEQARGDQDCVGPLADIYGIGAVLFHLLCGRPPLCDAPVPELLQQLFDDEPRLCADRLQRVPSDLEQICLKCLRKEPSHRYLSADALADDVQRFLDGRPVVARPLSFPARLARTARRKPLVCGLIAATISLSLFVMIGSTMAALYFRKTGDTLAHLLSRATSAEQESQAALFEAKLLQARQNSRSHREGQRYQSLEYLSAAQDILDELAISLDPRQTQRFRRQLRNEIVAALSVPDVRRNSRDREPVAQKPSPNLRLRSGDLWWHATDQWQRVTHLGDLRGFKVDPDHRLVATWSDSKLHVIDLSDPEKPRALGSRAFSRIQTVDWSHDGELIALGSADHFAYVFEAKAFDRPAHVLTGAQAWVNEVAFLSNGKLMATCRGEQRTRIYDTDTGEAILVIEGVGQQSRIGENQFDGVWMDNAVRWDYDESATHFTLTPPHAANAAMETAFDPTGKLLVVCGWDDVQLWDFENRKHLDETSADYPTAAAFVSLDSAIVSDESGLLTLRLDRENDQTQIGSATRAKSDAVPVCPCDLDYPASFPRAAVTRPKSIVLFGLRNRKLAMTGQLSVANMSRARLSRDGSLVAASSEHQPGVSVYDSRSGALAGTFATESTNPFVAIDAASTRLLVADGPNYHIVDARSMETLSSFAYDHPSTIPISATFSPSAKLIAVAHRRDVIDLIDASTGLRIVELRLPQNGTWLRFSPDESYLLCRDASIRLRVWDIRRIRSEFAARGLNW